MNRLAATLALLLTSAPAWADADKPLLLQKPTVSQTHVVFAFADDLWTVPRDGGDAQRLTSGPGTETDPIFSPDGKSVAFTGQYEGNHDVYVVPADGGVPRRVTYHPGPDRAIGWTPDGKRILFQTRRDSYSRFSRLFTMPAEGGNAEPLPLPMADHGCYSPDGQQLAYVPIAPAFRIWKRYRGGTATPVWIARLDDSAVVKVPRQDSNDFNPMWLGNQVYFLSDRNGPMSLFAYDTEVKRVRQVHENKGLDLKSASAGPDVIVYEQFGALHLFDPKAEKAKQLDVRIRADLPNVRPRFVKAERLVRGASISPTGVRAVFEARGEILTVPAKKGDHRNLTDTPGTAERDPAWSPDGKTIAYFSDASGEYELHLRDQAGSGKVKTIRLGKAPSFYYSPTWAPDSKKIAYTDKRLNIWYVDLDSGKSTLVDTHHYATREPPPAWSPDSRWLAYTKKLENHLSALHLHSLETGKSTRVTDGMSDARFAAFDKNGKYLYFTASTDAGPTMGGIEMTNFNFPVTRNVYVLVLRKDLPSPLAPESDEEKAAEEKADDKGAGEKPAPRGERPRGKKAVEPVRIDLDDIDQRILALPIRTSHYSGLMAGKPGVLFLMEDPLTPVGMGAFGRGEGPRRTLLKFELDKRKADKFLEGISGIEVSADGEKMLYRQGQTWFIGSTAQAARGGEGMPAAALAAMAGREGGPAALKLDDMEVRVDPRAEWKQMYDEVWRVERDFLYDPGFHGLDLKATAEKYRPYLGGVSSRGDLNYLFGEMLGELSLGHVYVMGGDSPEVPNVRGGLLGADYKVENGRYRFARVYRGENWNPQLKAPLTQPGVSVKEGEYLLAVSGKELRGTDNVYQPFEGTAGKSLVIRVGPNADGTGARDVTVVPIDNEGNLRNRAWVEDNRRKVERLTKGRVAYVYLPDTAVGGYTQFNREYFAQAGKEAAVIDERFNGGGKAADYIIMHMARPLLNYWTTREGADYATPAGAIFGPKVMITNEMAGSGGDWLPWCFRRAKLGPLVGKRTWGGLVGIGGYPQLIDGGMVTAPHFAFWTPEGDWEVENKGVPPDHEVDLDPQAVRAGRDPQLEKAVELVLEALQKNPPPKGKRPAFPNYHKKRDDRTGKATPQERPAASPGKGR